ncbi:MAG: methyltransferase domain-containing protein [Mycobacteriales bacterium]|nr:methyltransferase domain-containing protein [Mycobacteriales bacterium]
MTLTTNTEVEQAVSERYGAGAQAVEAALCCPVDYDPRFLTVIPQEVLDRDYGCGDPSTHLLAGETVLDLGSGGGKICFIASQVVGAEGRVIGVDMTDEMLDLARSAEPKVAEAVGYSNVEFRKGKIQDMRLDVAGTEAYLAAHPVSDLASLQAYEAHVATQRLEQPLVGDASVDAVVSNCVLNLVAHDEKPALFAEIFRVLKRGGRAVISDIVSDVEVPEHLRADADLWSGCISGAFQEEAFLQAFLDAGFYGVVLDKRDSAPWQTVEGIEFRSVTVVAYKGKQGPCYDHGQAVIFKGPWSAVVDDDEHVYERGVPTAVCAKTFEILSRAPYGEFFELLEPAEPVDPATAPLFACAPPATATATGTSAPLRRAVAGMSTAACAPDSGCC